ncbi:MAG: hypothetical protein AB7L13_08985 [Acidimicrobiia bacterium]
MSRYRVRRFGLLLVAAAMLVTACGGSSPKASVDPGSRPDLPIAAASSPPFLPPVTVWDVTEKRWVQLANFLPADLPLLVWFWAPH